MTISSKQYLIICGAGALLLLCVCAGIGSNLSGTDTTTQVAHVTTKAPAAKPTVKPSPTAVPTFQQRIDRIAKVDGTKAFPLIDAKDISVTYDATTKGILVTVVMQNLGLSVTQDEVKQSAFSEEEAFWAANIPLHDVDVLFLGPVQNQYGNARQGKYGEIDLTSATAGLFNWSNLDPYRAWTVYDYAYVIQH